MSTASCGSRLVAEMNRTSTTASCCSLPDPPDHAVLDDPEQLGLERHRHLGELVEEQRPAVGGLEQARLVAVGAGEGALPVAEHLALEQRLGQRGAVDRHQRPARPPAVLVDELGDDLLAGAALAADEHRGVGGGHLAGQLDRLAEERRDPDQRDLVAVAVLLHAAGRRRSCASRDIITACEARPMSTWRWVARERLGQVVPGAGPQRLDAARDAGVSGHHHDDRVLVGLQRGAEDVQSRDLRHVEIDEDDVELPPLDRVERLLAPARPASRCSRPSAARWRSSRAACARRRPRGPGCWPSLRSGMENGSRDGSDRAPWPTGPGRAGWTSGLLGRTAARSVSSSEAPEREGDGSTSSGRLEVSSFYTTECGGYQAIAAPGQQVWSRLAPQFVDQSLQCTGVGGLVGVRQRHLLERPDAVSSPPRLRSRSAVVARSRSSTASTEDSAKSGTAQ